MQYCFVFTGVVVQTQPNQLQLTPMGRKGGPKVEVEPGGEGGEGGGGGGERGRGVGVNFPFGGGFVCLVHYAPGPGALLC